MAKTKTKDYMLRAHNNYIHKRDRIAVIAPLGTVSAIKKVVGEGKISAYICDLIAEDLSRRGIQVLEPTPEEMEEREKRYKKPSKKREQIAPDPSAQAGPDPDPQEETPDWFN